MLHAVCRGLLCLAPLLPLVLPPRSDGNDNQINFALVENTLLPSFLPSFLPSDGGAGSGSSVSLRSSRSMAHPIPTSIFHIIYLPKPLFSGLGRFFSINGGRQGGLDSCPSDPALHTSAVRSIDFSCQKMFLRQRDSHNVIQRRPLNSAAVLELKI